MIGQINAGKKPVESSVVKFDNRTVIDIQAEVKDYLLKLFEK